MHSLTNTPEETWANTILYRLGKALGYPANNGVIEANPDEILERALVAVGQNQNPGHSDEH